MNDTLRALRERALKDAAFRAALLATREAADPLDALCRFACENGFPLTMGEIISDGEEFSCNQTKSTNGGNPMPYDCFDDAYDMFFASIEQMPIQTFSLLLHLYQKRNVQLFGGAS